MRWDDLQLFLAVAQEGGLSPAAQVTGRSPATLGRRMLALERDAGVTLFVRHDRGYTLTTDGRALLDGVEDIAIGIGRLMPQQGDKLPVVAISAGTWTTLSLLPQMEMLAGAPPDLSLRFVSSEAALDLRHREVMIGCRNERPTGDNLAGRKLGQVHFAPYHRVGAPDLWIKVVAQTPSARWVAVHAGDDVVCEVNAPRNALDLALAGQGKVLLPTFIGDARDALQRCGRVVDTLSHDRWIVSHQDDRHLPHIRRAIDRLVVALT